nr:ABC transporter permease subunit [uncultured Blautia sp.]
MSVKKSETALAERIGRKKLLGIKYLLLAVPFLIYVFAFSYVPLVGWIYSVFDYKIGQKFLDFGSMVFVGLGNFQKLFTERSEVLRVLRNTLALSALGLLATPVPVVFAIMFNEIKNSKFKKIVQTATTLPNFISWIIVYGVAFAFFSVNGFVSVLMQKIGIQPPVMGILGDVDHTWVLQWILGIWKSFGWSAIIYIAAITGIDSELYDAAKVDGANKIQSILHITIPGIMPTYVVMFLLAVSNILSNGFDQYFMFYNPMVADKIEVLDYYVYKVGFYINDYSYSITLGMLKSILGIVLLFTANALSKKIRGESIV